MAGNILGVTRQRLHPLRDGNDFPSPLVDLPGAILWSRASVEAFAAGWTRRPGRPAIRNVTDGAQVTDKVTATVRIATKAAAETVGRTMAASGKNARIAGRTASSGRGRPRQQVRCVNRQEEVSETPSNVPHLTARGWHPFPWHHGDKGGCCG